ncbi:hypothetical protein HZC09_01595 [Candidatus Micrarchaeota archaeon]|nr:hypothetical protein [Candidatus Micrarchaeota archaeon]
MDRTLYVACIVLAGLGLLFSIEWLFLTFLLIFLLVAFMERYSSSPVSPEASFQSQQAQQPVVIQASQASTAHQFYTSVVQEAMGQIMHDNVATNVSSLDENVVKLQDTVIAKVNALEESMDKKFKDLKKRV